MHIIIIFLYKLLYIILHYTTGDPADMLYIRKNADYFAKIVRVGIYMFVHVYDSSVLHVTASTHIIYGDLHS